MMPLKLAGLFVTGKFCRLKIKYNFDLSLKFTPLNHQNGAKKIAKDVKNVLNIKIQHLTVAMSKNVANKNFWTALAYSIISNPNLDTIPNILAYYTLECVNNFDGHFF